MTPDSRLPHAADPLQIMLARANQALRGRDAQTVGAAAQAAVAIDPGCSEAHYLLGSARLMEGRLDEAIASYRRVIELAPAAAPAHCNLGIILGRKGQTEEAI